GRSRWARGAWTRGRLSTTTEEAFLHRLVADPPLFQILRLGGLHLAEEGGMVGEDEVLEQVLVEIDQSSRRLPVPGDDHISLRQASHHLGRIDLQISERYEFHVVLQV